MQVQTGSRTLDTADGTLAELRDANNILHDREALWERMGEDGYLLIRGLHDRQKVLAARRVLVEQLQAEGALAPGSDPMDAVINPADPRARSWNGRKGLTHHADMLALLESPQVMGFFSFLFGEAAMTYDYKWLRGMSRGSASAPHYDVVYMGRGTIDHLRTCWTPLGDVAPEQGSLMLLLGSHNLPSFQKVRDTYGRMDVDRDRVAGSLTDEPAEIAEKFGGKWATTTFEVGDALIFGMYTMHCSCKNVTDRIRLSADTRYQPASAPVDPRWVGDNPIAHYAWHTEPEKSVPMAKMRASWGI